jgi:hypothetical protein
LTAGGFHFNGRANLTIEEKEQTVGNEPYSYTLSVKDAKVDGVPVKILADPAAKKRNIIRYTGILLFFGGGIFGVAENGQYIKDAQRFKEIQGDRINYREVDFLSAQSKRNKASLFTVLGYILGLAGAGGFSWSFTF